MRQYYRFRSQHPGCLLLFRMGDFYELFDEDAVTAHKALGITLTERTKGVPMAGVPFHAVEGYLQRLIAQGFRVAVCEQIQDPRDAKGVVERAVTRVLTPGTLVDESLLEAGSQNLTAALALAGPRAAIAAAELSTGEFTVVACAAADVADELARLAPAELLVAEEAHAPPRAADTAAMAVSVRPAWHFRAADAAEALQSHFGVATLAGFGLEAGSVEVAACGSLLAFLRESIPEGAAARLAHLRPPQIRHPGRHLIIDATSLRSLEVERTLRSGGREGSLLAAIESPRTPMGRRLLRQWLAWPLAELAAIRARQRQVAALVEDEALLLRARGELESVQDVPRIAARAALGRATPRDAVALGRSVAACERAANLLEARPAFAPLHAVLRGAEASLTPLAVEIAARCAEAPPAHMREGGLFRDGADRELDECRSLQRDAGAWLAEYQRSLVERTGIASLKVGFNRVFGYYIEVSHARSAGIPADFTRTQTLKGAERYVTPELRTFGDRVLSAESRGIEREKALFDDLCRRIAERAGVLAAFADAMAALDAAAALAATAARRRWTAPEMVETPELRIRQGRHPVLEPLLESRLVPNDCLLATADQPAALALITGPNMAGKSTFIRQAALVTLLAHAGSFVPAEHAVVGLTDRILTRIGSADELHAGQSTFMVEMTETAAILHHATARSLVILDEVGRGTSTLDGLSLAWAIAERLALGKVRTLFATHYHELTGLADQMAGVANLHVSVREWGDQIIFLHRIVPGRTDRSYGIHVARLAGLPPEVVSRAQSLLEQLSVQHAPPAGAAALAAPGGAASSAGNGAQLSLFTEYLSHPAVDALAALDLDRLTPLAAFDELRRLRGLLHPAPAPAPAPGPAPTPAPRNAP